MEEVSISQHDAMEVMWLIQEYLHDGGNGRDTDALERVMEALFAGRSGSRIVIAPVTLGDLVSDS